LERDVSVTSRASEVFKPDKSVIVANKPTTFVFILAYDAEDTVGYLAVGGSWNKIAHTRSPK
jgi:hypothetical protein